MAAFHSTTSAAARTAGAVALHPVSSDTTAAVLIATVTARPRPHRCAVSLPVTETAIPARPATVKSTVGSGSQDGAPWLAHAAARNVTPHARSADNSKVWTV